MHILLAIADYRYYTISHWLYATGIHEEICSTVQRYLEKVTWKVNYFTERLAEYERTKGDGQ